MPNVLNTVLLNRYRVDAYIDSGGMGVVYRVWDLKRNVPLAMKMLHADLAEDPHVFKRFEREARALQKLAHPNIIPFYGIYNAQDFAFILEQYVEGPSLNQYLKRWRGQALPMQEILVIMRAMCTALGYAHSFNVIHCDVKPGNVLIDRGGSIYLTDFGVARHADSMNTTMAGIGTAGYMSPEQIRGDVVNAATDVYSLGIVLYEMLTGRRPFRGSDSGSDREGGTANARVRNMHINQAPPDPRQFNPNISPELVQVLLTSMAKNPAERFISTQAFFNAVCEAVGVSSEAVPERLSMESLANIFIANQVAAEVRPAVASGNQSSPIFLTPPPYPSANKKPGIKKWGTIGFAGGIMILFAVIMAWIGIRYLQNSGVHYLYLPVVLKVYSENPTATEIPGIDPEKGGIAPPGVPTAVTVKYYPSWNEQPRYDLTTSGRAPAIFRFSYWIRPTGYEGGASCQPGTGLYFAEAPDNVIIPGSLFGSTIITACGWKANEAVNVSMTYPGGEVQTEMVRADSFNTVIINEYFGYGSQLGQYFLVMSGESGRLEHNFTVSPPDQPVIIYTPENDAFFGYLVPGERVVVGGYRMNSNATMMTLVGWGEYTVEADGTLYVRNTVQADIIVGMAEKTGLVKGRHLMDSLSDAALKFAVPACANAPTTRLANSGLARVTPDEGYNNLRSAPGLSNNWVGKIDPGEVVQITSGPVCANNMHWWQVISMDGTKSGWVAEGDIYEYWLEPAD